MKTIPKVQFFPMHELHVVKRSQIQKRWLYLDTETRTVDIDSIKSERFYLGWTCFRESWSRYWSDLSEWRFWNDERVLCEYIEKKATEGEQIILVGHNIFFDLQACGFFMYFTEWQWQLNFIYDKGLTYILKVKKHKKTLIILSTTNWFDQSLKKLGEMIGLEKKGINFRKATDRQLKIYCKRDVDILIKAVGYYIAFIKKHRLGYLGMTKSAQSFIAYRHRFMYHKIMVHSDPEVTELERKAYIGGRVECFSLGKQKGGPFITLDVNSMYPFVMANYFYPWKLVEHNIHTNINDYIDILKTFSVVAHIEIDTPEPAFAVHYNKKIVFPVGKFACYVCSTGFEYALKRGYIKKIHNIAVYSRSDLFSGYVNYFYTLKTKYAGDKNKIMVKLCKYMLNTLYGKFGQKGIVKKEFDQFTGREYWKENVLDMVTGERIIIIKLMNKLIYQYSEDEGENAFPGLAGHITENARFVLWELIKSIGREKVIYCDTDSVKIRKSDMDHMHWDLPSAFLGSLKIEDESNELYIGGCKNYRTEKGRTIKGIPSKAVEVHPDVFKFTSFGNQNIHLRTAQIVGFRVSEVTRHIKTEYDKGVVHKDGRITPFVFGSPHLPF